MKNIMLDIETLATCENALIISIGAVFFDIETGKLGKTFYKVIESDPFYDKLFKIDFNTVNWWMEQPNEAIDQIFCATNKTTISNCLNRFSNFIYSSPYHQVIKVWAKSPSFDCLIVKNAYSKLKTPVPWKYKNERDVRTFLEMSKNNTKIENRGTHHNALDDAIHQANQVISAVN